jgi:hypothetical protein
MRPPVTGTVRCFEFLITKTHVRVRATLTGDDIASKRTILVSPYCTQIQLGFSFLFGSAHRIFMGKNDKEWNEKFAASDCDHEWHVSWSESKRKMKFIGFTKVKRYISACWRYFRVLMSIEMGVDILVTLRRGIGTLKYWNIDCAHFRFLPISLSSRCWQEATVKWALHVVWAGIPEIKVERTDASSSRPDRVAIEIEHHLESCVKADKRRLTWSWWMLFWHFQESDVDWSRISWLIDNLTTK